MREGALNLHQFGRGSSAITAERRGWLPYVCRVGIAMAVLAVIRERTA